MKTTAIFKIIGALHLLMYAAPFFGFANDKVDQTDMLISGFGFLILSQIWRD